MIERAFEFGGGVFTDGSAWRLEGGLATIGEEFVGVAEADAVVFFEELDGVASGAAALWRGELGRGIVFRLFGGIVCFLRGIVSLWRGGALKL